MSCDKIENEAFFFRLLVFFFNRQKLYFSTQSQTSSIWISPLLLTKCPNLCKILKNHIGLLSNAFCVI